MAGRCEDEAGPDAGRGGLLNAVCPPVPVGIELDRATTRATVTVSYRTDYSDDRVSARELEALAPVLPELVSELLTLMNLSDDAG